MMQDITESSSNLYLNNINSNEIISENSDNLITACIREVSCNYTKYGLNRPLTEQEFNTLLRELNSANCDLYNYILYGIIIEISSIVG
ncbi:hypothetical protein [Clostridium tertium]|uniref:hypothetical protein n=1 Tax=Clostridium tertium TaxID=1559 RepID=UPI0023B21A90|nr:hypothetical protein [Clostridium tertium]